MAAKSGAQEAAAECSLSLTVTRNGSISPSGVLVMLTSMVSLPRGTSEDFAVTWA